MRHLKARGKLNRDFSHRSAMLRNMVTSLFKHEELETTDARAKQLRATAEKMITLAKRGDLHSRRQALSYIREKAVAHRIFEELKDRYMDRQGGYIRIIKKGNRKGDGASVSIIQLLPGADASKKDKKRAKKKAKTSVPKGAAKMKEEKVQGKANTGETAIKEDDKRTESKEDLEK